MYESYQVLTGTSNGANQEILDNFPNLSKVFVWERGCLRWFKDICSW